MHTFIRKIKENYLFLVPLIAFTIIFILVPVVGTIINGFYRDIPFMPRTFNGIENFKQLAGDPGFLQALRFTIFFTIVSVVLEVTFGIAIALLLNYPLPYRGLLRAVILIPWAIPAAISARTWELIYNYNYGLANALFLRLGWDGPINWLGSSGSAFTAIVIADIWKTTPFAALIILAGVAAIPEDLYRQAQVDGAHVFQRLWKITLPLLRPIIVVTLLFRTIDALRVFDLNYVLTHGGPGGSTTSLSLYGYKYFLVGDFGYGSAISVALFIIAFALSVAYVRIGKFSEGIQK